MTRAAARWLSHCMRQSWHALRSPRTAPWSGASGRADAGGRVFGVIGELGRLVGVPTPSIDMVYALAKQRAVEAGGVPG